jgi:hypothetical protein
MERGTGFEPATSGLGKRHNISYQRLLLPPTQPTKPHRVSRVCKFLTQME